MMHKDGSWETSTPPDRLAAGLGVGQQVQPRSNSTARPRLSGCSTAGSGGHSRPSPSLTLTLLLLRWSIHSSQEQDSPAARNTISDAGGRQHVRACHRQMCDVKQKRPLTGGLVHDWESGAGQLRTCLAEETAMPSRCDGNSAP